MFKVIPVLFLAATAVACNPTNSTTTTSPGHDSIAVEMPPAAEPALKQLEGYFVNNTVRLTDGFSVLHPTNQQEFDQLLGIAQTMNNTIEKPDFDKNIIVALTHSATDQMEAITLKGSKIENGIFTIIVAAPETPKKSFTVTPLALFSATKVNGLKQIVFENEQKVQLGVLNL